MSAGTPFTGANLVCPVCGLLRINHDCVGERTNPKPKRPEVSLQELLFGGKKAKRPRKEKPWDGVPSVFFAWRGGKSKIGKQRGFKDPNAKWYGHKDADYVSVWSFKKGGAGKHRTVKNLAYGDTCYSDIDSDLPLPWRDIIDKCVKHNIPKPYLIPETSPNHYQPRWRFPKIGTDLLGMWQEVQDGLYEMLKEFGADPQAKDAIRYLRNPKKCRVVYSDDVCTTSLTVLYRSLKMAGFIKAKPKPKWPTKFSPDGIPIKESRQRLEVFLNANPEHESTYKELAKRLSIPLRTIKYLIRQLKRDGRLETRLAGKAKTRRTVFSLRSAFKDSLNTLHSKGAKDSAGTGGFTSGQSSGKHKKESPCAFTQALGKAKALGLAPGVRNTGFFSLGLWLKTSKKMSYDDIFRELYSVLILTSGFSRREFERTLKSACRDKYRKSFKSNNSKLERFFDSLGLGGLH